MTQLIPKRRRYATLISGIALSAALSLSPVSPARAADEAPSAANLAAQLAAKEEGIALVRLRLDSKGADGGAGLSLQIQIKERRAKNSAEVVYQILWPKERKGESVLLRKAPGRAATGTLFTPPDKTRPITANQMNDGLFGSDLTYEDVIENFFAWESQTIAGSEAVNGVNCTILESKPGKGDHSSYTSVRSWIDPKRIVPLRVEKYSAPGRVARRIDTTRVASDDNGKPIPANLAVRGGKDGSVTELDGSKIKHDVNFTDRDFSPEGLGDLTPPK